MDIAFLQAKYSFIPKSERPFDWAVLHAAVTAEKADRAEWLMKYCANNDRKASWHYALDCDSITQSVLEAHIAYHAGRTANTKGIALEFATEAEPTVAGWDDPYSKKMLQLGSFLLAGICKRRAIPPVFVDSEGLKAGRRGVTTHAEVAKAFPTETTHTDPGPNFPMESFLADVSERISSGSYQETWR
jgi:N-acetyl-anhydromuramyl-L-alanine amidase AmpD